MGFAEHFGLCVIQSRKLEAPHTYSLSISSDPLDIAKHRSLFVRSRGWSVIDVIKRQPPEGSSENGDKFTNSSGTLIRKKKISGIQRVTHEFRELVKSHSLVGVR